VISESSVRSDLHFNDEDGITCPTNTAIFENLALLGVQSQLLEEFPLIRSASFDLATTGSRISLTEPFNDTYETLKHTKKVFSNKKRKGKDFSGRVTPLFASMLAPPVVGGEGSGQPSKPQPPSSTTQHIIEEQIPISVPIPNVADKAVFKDRDDKVVTATTTAASLDVAQASGNITKTQYTAMSNDPLSQVIGSGDRPSVRNYEFLVPIGSYTQQDLYICVAEEDMACTTSTPDNEVTYMTETEVREFNAKLEKKHVNNKYNMVTSCSYDNLKKLYDELQKQFSDLNEQYNEYFIQVQAYKNSLKTLEKQKRVLQTNQLTLEDKIRVLSSELENTTNLLKYSEKVNAEMSLEKQDLQAKLENERTINAKWKESSKNMDKLINSSMSSRSKFGLGFGETFGSDEVFDPSAPSIFDTTPEDVEGKPLYNRFVKTDRMKAVPPPLSGNYIPLSDPTDLDESQMTYGPKQTYTSDSEPKTIDLDSCESNSSVESLESMPKPVIIEPKTSEYASCKSNLSAKSPEFFPKSVCARNESVRKADNPRKNNKSPRAGHLPWLLLCWLLRLVLVEEYKVPTGSTQFLLVVRFSLPGLLESLPGLLESPGLMERDEHQYHIDQTTPLVQSCQRDPEASALSFIDQDLLYLKKGCSGPEKIVLLLHKFPTIIFNDDDIEERTSRWVNKCAKKFNPYARYGIKYWKNPQAKIFYIRKQKEPGKPKEEIVARRANECIVSITEPDYKNLNKNDIEDMYLLIMNGKVFSTWMVFGESTCDLGSFKEETDEITDLHQILKEILLIECGDGVTSIKRRRYIWNLEMAPGRGRLKEDLESST
ncbi:hypothetical protein Tco_0717273, partial [Tanacetum coccineum]